MTMTRILDGRGDDDNMVIMIPTMKINIMTMIMIMMMMTQRTRVHILFSRENTAAQL